jgi:FkbM family methyltransferase
MKTVFDFGMYDASDTIYYLEEGFKVVAVEANPRLAERARSILSNYINQHRLDIVNAAISIDNNDVDLIVSGSDLGSSSSNADLLANKVPIGKYTVPGITVTQIFECYGIPYYLKVDIEGQDHLCVKALSKKERPEYLSFEISNKDLDGLIDHLESVGYTRFKLINQRNFREITNENNLRDRCSRKLMNLMGYGEPSFIKYHGRFFSIGHSSGPAPWCSDGQWSSADRVSQQWNNIKEQLEIGGAVWYDLHAN